MRPPDWGQIRPPRPQARRSRDSASAGEGEAFRSLASGSDGSWQLSATTLGMSLSGTRLVRFGDTRLLRLLRIRSRMATVAGRHGDRTDSFVLSSTEPMLNEGRVLRTALKEVPHANKVTGRAGPVAQPSGRRPKPRNASGRPSPLCCRPSRAHWRRHLCAGLALGPAPTGDSRAGRQTRARGSREGPIPSAS